MPCQGGRAQERARAWLPAQIWGLRPDQAVVHSLQQHTPVPPVSPAVLYLHPICALGAAVKEGIMREAGFWFLDSSNGGFGCLEAACLRGAGRQAGNSEGPQAAAAAAGGSAGAATLNMHRPLPSHPPPGCPAQPGAASGAPACRPLHWRQPGAEAAHYSCPSFGLGLVHGRLPAAAQALRDGASGEEAQRLLQLSADKECNGKGEAQQQEGRQQQQKGQRPEERQQQQQRQRRRLL